MTTLQLTPYTKLLTFAKEKITEMMAPLRAREMRKKAELETAKLESKILEQENSITEIASKYPVEFDKLIDALDERDLLERRFEQFKMIITQMFPEDK